MCIRRDAASSTIDWTGEQLAERHAEVLGALAAVLDGIARGDFMVAPWDLNSACHYCDFDAICPRARSAYVERRSADERLARFTDELRSIP